MVACGRPLLGQRRTTLRLPLNLCRPRKADVTEAIVSGRERWWWADAAMNDRLIIVRWCAHGETLTGFVARRAGKVHGHAHAVHRRARRDLPNFRRATTPRA